MNPTSRVNPAFMRVTVRHGPAATPVVAGRSYRPFHGIASRGMLDRLPTDGQVALERWSPLLDAALAGDEFALATVPKDVVEAARACGMLTFAQSAAAAAQFVAHELREVVAPATHVELWNVKEGHTSSVWRLTVDPPERPTVRLALNVGRDHLASDELERSAAILDEVTASSLAVTVAAVVARGRVTVPGAPGLRPAVVVQEWVEGASELALLPRRGGGRRLYAVERWVTAEQEPGRIAGAVGHRLTDTEHKQVAECATRFLLDTVRLAGRAALRFPRIDVEHGDWMWGADGLYVVATAGDEDIVSCADARQHLRSIWTRCHAPADPEVELLFDTGTDEALCMALAAGHPGALLVRAEVISERVTE
jgi:hypothetical protein